MALLLNPFVGLIETKEYPHARAFRTTYKQKLLDTFRIFFGYFTYQPGKHGHVGLFDITLLVPLLAKLHEFLARRLPQSNIPWIVGYVLSGVQIIALLPRLIFSVIMTGLCLLPVALIHFGMGLFNGNKLKQEINSHQHHEYMLETVEEALAEKKTCLENISDIQVEKLEQPHLLKLRLFVKDPTEVFNRYKRIDEPTPAKQPVLELKLNTQTSPQFFPALKALNVGGIQSKKEAEERRGYWI